MALNGGVTGNDGGGLHFAEATERAASTSFVHARPLCMRCGDACETVPRDHTHAIVDGSRGERDDKAP
jgi:hypothetical protein